MFKKLSDMVKLNRRKLKINSEIKKKGICSKLKTKENN